MIPTTLAHTHTNTNTPPARLPYLSPFPLLYLTLLGRIFSPLVIFFFSLWNFSSFFFLFFIETFSLRRMRHQKCDRQQREEMRERPAGTHAPSLLPPLSAPLLAVYVSCLSKLSFYYHAAIVSNKRKRTVCVISRKG